MKYLFSSKRLSFREINISDADDIVRWRSDSEVYRFFKNPKLISKEEHIDWFLNKYSKDQSRTDLMAFDDNNNRVGVFGFIVRNNVAEVSYIVSPDQQRKGYATEGVLRLIRYISEKYSIETIIAEIHKDNKASIGLIKKLDFKLLGINGNFNTYEYAIQKMLYFRVDGNSEIGMGHIMRCISIADSAKKNGYQSTFIMSDNSCHNYVESHGIDCIVLNSDWKNLEKEREDINKIIKYRHIRSILVDSYMVSKEYFASLPCHTIYIDDLANEIYPVDALVCYAAYWKDFDYEKRYHDTDLLLGPKFTPLRSEFSNRRAKKINDIITNILILSGSTNPNSISLEIAEKLSKNNNYKITVVCGLYATKHSIFRNSTNIKIINNVLNMSELMEKADLAITAGGTTIYELCACGTPSISYSIAENQLKNVTYFDNHNIIKYAGTINDMRLVNIILSLIDYYSPKSIRQERSNKMRLLVDGCGAERLAKKMIEYSIEGIKK